MIVAGARYRIMKNGWRKVRVYVCLLVEIPLDDWAK